MRTLIDGYNLIYARGLLGRRLGPDGLRRVRQRFLNELAAALGAVEAYRTTVVFDAAESPGHLPNETTHKGLTVIFAAEDDEADSRIERLIAQHPEPKSLTVVSSDHRLRQAASRRRARALTAEEFLTELEARQRRRSPEPPAPPSPEERARHHGLSPDQAAAWLAEFGEIAHDPQTRDELASDPSFLTDAEIAEIERQVEDEFKS